jgi:hypothetical protein
MKKLLAIVLVLGMASMASAALDLQMSAPITDQNVTWSVVGTQLIGTGNALGGFDGSIGKVSGAAGMNIVPAQITDAAGFSTWYDDGFGGFGYTSATLGASAQSAPAIWFVLDIVGAAAGDSIVVETWNSADGWSGPTGSATITAVPEPLTMTLLGLGGLGLIRRRKA